MPDAATTAAKMVTARECGCILQKWEKKAKKKAKQGGLGAGRQTMRPGMG